ncbi:hypothetical protein AMS68_002918 [Peltaster fructicola]|uniref:Translation initiation factor eIF2B subunit beta n=1 Tax=Peltaster fructicola TaxID=286661 RepID=A0A6H0XRW8_9PEZI|nr:hypothetical protein AMS68_002918 [Peltaster fructicola]
MPSALAPHHTTSLAAFLKSIKHDEIDSAIELFVSLLQRRQIKSSRPCALATAHLLLRVIAAERYKNAQALIKRIKSVGRKLVAAQPREMAVGNIVRRVLGIVREIAEDELNTALAPSVTDPLPVATTSTSSPPSLSPQVTSLFGIFQNPTGVSVAAGAPIGVSQPSTKTKHSPGEKKEKIDAKAEIIEGIKELLDELDVVDTQIAETALDHIHSNEIILTHTSSQTVQRFLAAAARKRKFTLIHAEAYPNDHHATHTTVVNGNKKSNSEADEEDERWKPLTQMGITVILVPDSAVFALMSRINKVILAPHTVLADGSLIAAAGAAAVAQAANVHRVPVVVLSGVYKLSPVYPFDTSELIEYGDPGNVIDYSDGEFVDKVDVMNPLFDHVGADNVDLYITNLGAHAPSYLYRIVADHYRTEDIDLSIDN